MRLTAIVMLVLVLLSAAVSGSLCNTESTVTVSGALYLNDFSDQWAVFSIENDDRHDQVYVYEVYETKLSEESLALSGYVLVKAGSTAVVYYPLTSIRIERIRIRLPMSGQEVSFRTGYVHTEWRPTVVQDRPWDSQDPLVKHFYRFELGTSKDYERRI